MSIEAPVHHLVTVWNPAYANAMDESIGLLLARARDHRAGKLESEDDVFVWWGKVRSSNRQQGLPHLDEILAIDRELQAEDGDCEVYLYITDFRSLYVASVGEITVRDVAAANDAAVPAFYKKDNLSCDCWFRLFDIRRLVFDDTRQVVQELQRLANTRYNGRPVSIYGGMVELPIIATRADGVRLFDDDGLTNGQLWVEFDSQRSGVGRMERELRDNLIGETAWSALDPSARVFIATAETLFREHREDPAFDFSTVLIDLAKAFEVQVNVALRRALSSVAPKDRTYVIDGVPRDIAGGQSLTLGGLSRLIANEESLSKRLRSLVNGEWFTASLPPILRDLSERRNPAAHSARVAFADAAALRNQLLGVGCDGAIVQLARVRRR